MDHSEPDGATMHFKGGNDEQFYHYIHGSVPYSIKNPRNLVFPDGQPSTIIINGSIDAEALTKFSKQLDTQATLCDTVVVVIYSDGGSVEYGFRMGSLIESYKKNKGIRFITVALKAFSMAAYLFAIGDYRIILGNGNPPVMIHDLTLKNNELDQTLADTSAVAARYTYERRRMFEKMSEQCDKNRDYFDNLLRNNNYDDLYLSTQECVRHGLAHSTSIPKFEFTFNSTSSELLIDGVTYDALNKTLKSKASKIKPNASIHKKYR